MALAYPDPPLSDGAIVLRAWDERDLAVVERASADGYIATIEHLPVPFSLEAGRAWIAEQHELLHAGRGWAFAIVDGEANEAVGGVGIVFRRPPGAAEPGVWILEERRNSRLAERATRILCHWALGSGTGIERIQATVEPWNGASQRVLEKLGFVREGLLRSYASCGGARRDVLLYSLLRNDLE